MRRRPYWVVLFDEIEKAHHDVFNVLLQVLDDGRLTDGQGRMVDFKNTVIIMTSNIGSPIIQEYFNADKLGAKDHAEMEKLVRTELRAHFRPEFLNRVDDIIIFHSLDEKQLAQIVDIQLHRLEKRLAQQQLTLDVDRSAKTTHRQGRLRPAIWRAPAQTRHPGPAPGSAGDEVAGRRLQARRPDQGIGPRKRDRV